jgi:hypothetical protein
MFPTSVDCDDMKHSMRLKLCRRCERVIKQFQWIAFYLRVTSVTLINPGEDFADGGVSSHREIIVRVPHCTTEISRSIL